MAIDFPTSPTIGQTFTSNSIVYTWDGTKWTASLSPTGTLTVGLGTALDPSINFSGDSNTGFYSPGADQVAITTGGTQRVAVDASGNVTINGQGDIRLADNDSSNWLAFQAPVTVASNVTWTLPSADGTSNQLLSTNGSGTLSWSSVTSSQWTTSSSNIYYTSGNVGIGTTSPQNPLHVVGTGGIRVSDPANAVINIRGDSGANSYLYFAESSVAERGIIGYPAGSGDLVYRSGGNNFATGSERARIDSSGRLLLGTSTARSNFYNQNASTALQVEGTSLATASISITRNSNSASSADLIFGKTRGAVGDNTIVQNGDLLGYISFQGADGTELCEGVAIEARVDGTPGANDMPGRLVFSTTADGASSPTERMRISNTGRVGVNQSSPATLFDLNGSYAANITAVAALDIDCSLGNYFTKTINGNSTFTFSNPPSSRSYSFTLELTHTSGVVAWPATVKWPGDTSPTLTTGKTHLFVFVTDDGGTRWRGAALVDYVN